MYCSLLFPFLALTTPTLTSPTPNLYLRQSSESWTIRSFTRDCTDTSTCIYNFAIDTGIGLPSPCSVIDTANPATNHSFYAIPCQQTPVYEISWGWDYTADFTTMTVVNETSQLEAFFGYDHPNVGLPVVTYPDNGPDAVQHT